MSPELAAFLAYLGQLFAIWPVAMTAAAIICRLLAARIDDPEAKIVLETVAQVALIAAAVGYGLLFGRRVGL